MGKNFEIIIVDDNSPDGTGKFSLSLTERYPEVKVFIRTKERGLGSAVKRGIMESSGDILVVTDADLSHDPTIIPALVDLIVSNQVDIAIGSRFIAGGEMKSSLPHVWGSKLLNMFIRTLLRMPVKDVTGGFMAIRKDALKGLNLDAIFRGYGDYCFALLYKGIKQGWRTAEIGFSYQARELGEGKTGFFKVGFSYGFRALKLRVGLE